MRNDLEWTLQIAVLGLFVFLATPFASEASGLRWHETSSESPWRGQKLLIVENNLVSITLLPLAGGRVARYVEKTTGINHLHETPELKAEEAGGIWDKEGVWEEGNWAKRAAGRTVSFRFFLANRKSPIIKRQSFIPQRHHGINLRGASRGQVTRAEGHD
jgi:hypothetical protein